MKALIWALVAAVAPAVASAATQSSIIDTAYVEQATARGTIIWDVRPGEDYKRGHLPGAINIDDVLVVLRDPSSEDYIPLPNLLAILGEAGLDPDKEIVIYGPKAGTSAYFALVTLQYLGATKAKVYHGGIDDWKSAGKPVATDATKTAPVAIHARIRNDMIVSTSEVLKRLKSPELQLIDARTPKEYSGEDVRALRGGHIPGAVNIPYENNWVDPESQRKFARKQVSNKDGMSLKSASELRQMYLGLDPEKETIVYCQSGNRAAETMTVLQSIGFQNVKLYDSSWLAYGNAFDAPAESVSYFNVARVNNLLNALQSRIDALEEELTQLKTQGAKKP